MNIKSKNIIATILVLAMFVSVIATVASAAEDRIAYASTQTVDIDGTPVELQAYALKDANGNPTNYVKLRDIAYVLNGTEAQFEVTWDGGVNIVTGQSYTTNGSEMSTPFSGDRRYSISGAVTYVNGSVSDLEAITLTDGKGGAYTYYKLRDLGNALDFIVDWSAERGIYIETAKPQPVDLEPVTCVINPTGNRQYKCVVDGVLQSKWYGSINEFFDLRRGVKCKDAFGRTMYGLVYTDEEVTERYGITIKDGYPTSTDHLPDVETYYNETGNAMYHDEYGISWIRTFCGCKSAVGWLCIGDTGRWAEAPMKCTAVRTEDAQKSWCFNDRVLWFMKWRTYNASKLKNLNDECHATDEELTEHFGIAFKNGRPVSTDHLPDARTYRNETGNSEYVDEFGLRWVIITCTCGDAAEWFFSIPNDYYEFRGTANS